MRGEIGADVAIAGAGAAGMMAALAASAGGASVLLVERDPAAPSNLVISGGLFAAAGTRWQRAAGVEDGPERFAADILAKTGGAVDRALLRAVTRHAARAAGFLADSAAVPVHLADRAPWPGHSAPRLHATPAESGAELSALLRAACARRPGIRLLEAEVAGLLAEGGAVAGLRLSDGRRIRAPATILATGGFGADAARLAREIPAAAGALHVGSRAADGAGIAWAEAMGAELACMDSFQGQPHVCPGEEARLGGALPALGAILVNREGERFADETMGPSELAPRIWAAPGAEAVEIWDEAAQQAALAGGPFRAAVAAGAVRRFADAAALAAAFGLPPGRLAATLAACAGQGADPFGRARRRPLAPPFYAARVVGALAHTQGGVLVDERARVRRAGGGVIPGLFAAGGVACGVSGHGAAGYVPGNGLAQAFALGLLAGEAAAQRAV
ncbi:MAG: FAD-binding protein [Acetobacteraceae bacterium]|nr:FAD-binding protein [Acetobacteraceae bacterium]